MTEPQEGERWRDERGVVRVTWVSTDRDSTETRTRIGYVRDGVHGHMLGLRRFLRDFKRVRSSEGRDA